MSADDARTPYSAPAPAVIRAGMDAAEAQARAAQGGEWIRVEFAGRPNAEAVATFIMTHDPASVLARIGRDRQALADAEAQRERHQWNGWSGVRAACVGHGGWPCPDRVAADAALARLAATYAPRASAREEAP